MKNIQKKKIYAKARNNKEKKPKKCLRIHWLAHLEMEMKCVEYRMLEREALEAGEVYV
jgi:hypothetical protein